MEDRSVVLGPTVAGVVKDDGIGGRREGELLGECAGRHEAKTELQSFADTCIKQRRGTLKESVRRASQPGFAPSPTEPTLSLSHSPGTVRSTPYLYRTVDRARGRTQSAKEEGGALVEGWCRADTNQRKRLGA